MDTYEGGIYGADGSAIIPPCFLTRPNAALIVQAVNGHGVVSEKMAKAALMAFFHDAYPGDQANAARDPRYLADMIDAIEAALAARGGGG